MTYSSPPGGYPTTPGQYAGQLSEPPHSGSYLSGCNTSGYPPPASKTPVIVLSVTSVLLLLAIIGVTGFALVNTDDDSGDDTASSQNDPSKKPTGGPTPKPHSETVGSSATPYQFEVPTSFEQIKPPKSTYLDSYLPSYEHAVAPESARDPSDAIIVSAWGGQEDETDISDTELVRMMDDVATNLEHTSPGKNANVDGRKAREYVKSDTINTFVLADSTFIQIRCQYQKEEKKIKTGCDQVLESINFR